MRRRDFLKTIPLGLAATAIPFSFGRFGGQAIAGSPLLGALTNTANETDRVLVIINLSGGNDGLNTVVPFEDPTYIKERSTLRLRDTEVFKIRQDLGINAVMKASSGPSFDKLWTDGKLAVVQNVGYADPNRSHFRSTDIWNTATDSNVILATGWVGRYLQSIPEFADYPLGVKPGDDPIALDLSNSLSSVFQGSNAGMGLAVSDPTRYQAASAYDDDPVAATNAGAELNFIRSILIQSDIYGDRFKALFPGPGNPPSKVTYPTTNRLAQQLKKVAWCIAAGMKTRVYFVAQGGYDTHVNQYSTNPALQGQGQLLQQLSEAISYFQADLEGFGIADRVLGMTYSEFGRRVYENGSAGTDHGTCAPQFLFGTQVNGEVYGSHPNLTSLDSSQDMIWETDFRQLYSGILGDWFGVSPELRKSILLDASGGDKFGNKFKVNGTSTMQSLIKTPAAPSAVESAKAASGFRLYQNYPNPFNPVTTIRFDLAGSEDVRLEVFDSRGSLVATLLQGRLGRGEHIAQFDAARLPSGSYFYRLETGAEVQTKSMTLAK